MFFRVFETAIYVSTETNWQFFLGKVMVFPSSQYFDQNNFGLWEKTFAKGCQNCIRRVQMKALGFFLRKTLNFCNFCTLSGKLSDLCKTFRAGFPKHQSKRPGIFFAKNFWKFMTFFSNFCNLREKVSDFGKKNSRQGIKNHILRVHENVLTKQLSWKNDSFSVNFRNLNGNNSYFERKLSGVFAKTIRAWFSKPQFTCPGKHFAKSFFL